jgi:hypothetical protein
VPLERFMDVASQFLIGSEFEKCVPSHPSRAAGAADCSLPMCVTVS